MYAHRAAPWSGHFPDEVRDRTTHHKRPKRRGREEQRFLEDWTWEEILEGKGPWEKAGEYWHPSEEIEAAKAERRQYEELAQRSRHERLAESGWRPEPTPRAYRKGAWYWSGSVLCGGAHGVSSARSRLDFGWATQGLSHSCSQSIPVLLWLYACSHCPVGSQIFNPL